MKTKFLRIGKSSVAMVLSLLMVLSSVLVGSVGTLDASAEPISIGSINSVYLVGSMNEWTASNDWKLTKIDNDPNHWGGTFYLKKQSNNYEIKVKINDSLYAYSGYVFKSGATRAEWLWTDNNGSSPANDQIQTSDISTEYVKIGVEVWGSYDNNSKLIINRSTVSPLQTTLNLSSSSGVKTGDTVTLSSTGVSGGSGSYVHTYKVTDPNGITTTLTGNTFTPTIAGNYKITDTVTDSNPLLSELSATSTKNLTVEVSQFTNVGVASSVGSNIATFDDGTIANRTVDGSIGVKAEKTITVDGVEYRFVKWTSDKGGTFADEYDINTTFNPADNDETATANYAVPVDVKITPDSSNQDGGNVKVSPELGKFAPGERVTLSITNYQDWSVSKIKVGDNAEEDVNGATSYDIYIPENATGTVSVVYKTEEVKRYYITALLDSKYTSYGKMYINDEEVGTEAYNAKYPNGYPVVDTKSVTVKLTDNNRGKTNHNNVEYIINGFAFSDNYSAPNYSNKETNDAKIASRDEALNSDGYSFTFYPKSSVTVTGSFKEDEGTGTYNYLMYGNSNHYDVSGSYSGNFAGTIPIVKTVTNKYYAIFDDELFQHFKSDTNCFFGITTYSSISGYGNQNKLWNNSSNQFTLSYPNDDDDLFKLYSEYIKLYHETTDGYNHAIFNIQNDYVSAMKVQVLDPNSSTTGYLITPTLSDSSRNNYADRVSVIAKDGTIRGAYNKYANLADTVIYSMQKDDDNYSRDLNNDNYKLGYVSVNAKSYDGYAETANIPKGSTITIRTTINSGTDDSEATLRNKYYVRAFNINGETYGLNDTLNTDGVYECTYTIPEDISVDTIEITPVYYYYESNASDYITFYVENFDDGAKEQWGTPYSGNNNIPILSCYAWYGHGQDMYSAGNRAKPALGGYPGQPMVYANGRYEMQVPVKNDANNQIQGITLNNYVWDYVHSNVLGAKEDWQRERINCQTYDYDDFIVLKNLITAEDSAYNNIIVFRFKYETNKNNSHNEVASKANLNDGNQPTSGNINLSEYNEPTGNGWEYPFVDYHGNTIDIFNNDLTAKGIDANDSTVKSQRFHIVSDGYRDIYFGHFAVLWSVYDYNGKFIGKLPSSALLYSGDMTGTTRTNPPTWFMPKDNNTTYNSTTNFDTERKNYWAVYFDLYYGNTNGGKGTVSALDKTADITYETAIRAEDYNSGGHPRDPGLRCDGRWYYSRKAVTFKANIIIEYKPTENSKEFVEDSYILNGADLSDEELSTASKPMGKVTGARPNFTNSDTTYENKVIANNVEVNKDDTFKFAVQGKTSQGYKDSDGDGTPSSESQTYKFIGWYLKQDDGYSKINPNEIDKITGETGMIGAVTLVARYIPYSAEVLTIKHDLYKDNNEAYKFSESPNAHNGDGTPTVKKEVTVTYTDGNEKKTATIALVDSGDNYVTINKTELQCYKEIDPNATISVTLEVETKGNTTTDGVDSVTLADLYRKTNDETRDENDTSTKNTTVGYVSFTKDTSTTTNTDAYGVSTWSSDSSTIPQPTEGSVSGEKKYSVDYTCKISDLFKENGTLKTSIVRFFADLTAPSSTINANIIIEYKKNATDTEYTVDSYVDSSNNPLSDEALSTTSNPQGKVTGATPTFTNNGDYKNKVVAKDVTVSEDGFEFEVPGTTSTGYKANDDGTPDTTTEQTYVFVGWYIKDSEGNYTEINPDYVDQLTGKTDMDKDVTLVARYVPLGDTITIQHDLYKDNNKAQKFSNSPAAHSGDGTPTVNKVVKVEYTDSNGKHEEIISLVNSSDNSVTIDKAALSKYLDTTKYQNAKIYVTLEVETSGNTESNPVVLADLYRKTNDETGSEKDLNNKIGYVSFKKDNQENTTDAYGVLTWHSNSSDIPEATGGSGSEKKYSVVYNCEISDLFEEDGTLKTNIVRFFADLSLSSINVVFKYYDRNDDTNKSQPETVDVYPTTLTVYDVELQPDTQENGKTVKGLTNTIAKAYETKGVKLSPNGSESQTMAVKDISSVIDTYIFWTSQDDAKKSFAGFNNHHNGDNYYSDNVTYHADCYGYISSDGEDKYLKDYKDSNQYKILSEEDKAAALTEKWVTYIDRNGNDIAEETALADPSSVKEVIVWGFNTPKDYTIDFYYPTETPDTNNGTKLGYSYTVTKDDETTTDVDVVTFTPVKDSVDATKEVSGKYNERVGRTYNADGIDDLSPYLKKVYGLESSSNGKVTDGNNDDVTAHNVDNYDFDGWYKYENGKYVKVSSDQTYANRFTATLQLVAGYRPKVVKDEDVKPGLTLSKNQVERYINEQGVERIRYTTQVNTYGCNDSDYNIKDIAIIYIKPATSGTEFTQEEITAIQSKIVATNPDIIAALNDTERTNSATIRKFSGEDAINGVIYAYDVVITTNDGKQYDADTYNPDETNTEADVTGNDVVLTNKNRAQFTLDLKADSVVEGKSNYDIIVYAAFNYAGTTIISDNYLEYKNEPIVEN